MLKLAWFSQGLPAFLISLAVSLVLIAVGVLVIIKRKKVAEASKGIAIKYSMPVVADLFDEVYVVFTSVVIFLIAGVIIYMTAR